jgi:CheY-like chemotaxis protein
MRVLIAEDEPDIWKAYKIALESRDHEVIIAEDGNKCLEIYNQELLEQQKRRGKDDDDNNNNNNNGSNTNRKNRPPFDVVVLDYRIPKKDGLQVAKEMLELSPNQRIIFASAYVLETLEDSVKLLKRVVELLQKPFIPKALVDTIEDKEAQEGLRMLMMNLRNEANIRVTNDGNVSSDENNGRNGDSDENNDNLEPSLEQIADLFEGLRKIQKGRTF